MAYAAAELRCLRRRHHILRHIMLPLFAACRHLIFCRHIATTLLSLMPLRCRH
jgi:hypothetical protein